MPPQWQATTQRAGPHKDPLTASSGRPSDQPQSWHVLHGSSGWSYPSGAHAFPRSPHQLKSAQHEPSGKSPPRGHQGGGLPEVLRRKQSPDRQRSGLAVTEEWRPGRRRAELATRRGAGDPVRRAEWMTVSRYGHLQSAPVVVDVGVRTEREPPTLRAPLWDSTRLAPPRWLPDSPATRKRVCTAADYVRLRAKKYRSSREMQCEVCSQAVQTNAVGF